MNLKLNPVKFDYNDEWKAKYPSLNKGVCYSFIAQEYKEVFPEAIGGSGEYLENDPDEILTIDAYDAQIVTVKAVQELIKENQQLKVRIDKLEQIVNKLLEK